MKKILILFSVILTFYQSDAQTDNTPVYKRFADIPPFSIMRLPDSVKFTKNDLKRHKATYVMIFNPDCEHCRDMLREIITNAGLFKKTQFVMVSALTFSNIKELYEEYRVGDFPFITMGMDAGNFLGTYYSIQSVPSIYLYNKKGKFVAEFNRNTSAAKMAAAL